MATTATKNGQVKALDPELINIEDLSGDDVYETQRGFKLRITPVPLDLIVEARSRIPVPEAPLVPVKGPDGVIVPNKFDQVFSDPKYIKARDEYETVIKRLTFQVMAAYGVMAYAVPEGFYKPEDEGWVKDLIDEDIFTVEGVEGDFTIKVPGPDRPRARFATWLRLYVMTQIDAEILNDAFLRGVGKVLETDVEEAVESFPDK